MADDETTQIVKKIDERKKFPRNILTVGVILAILLSLIALFCGLCIPGKRCQLCTYCPKCGPGPDYEYKIFDYDLRCPQCQKCYQCGTRAF